MAILERRLRDCKSTSPFLPYAHNITSQGGEDGVIEKLFQHLNPSNNSGYCVDIGAWDGKHWSNTYTLLNDKKWGGLLVEANPERAEGLRKMYADRPDVGCCDCLVELNGPNALTKFLKEFHVKKDFDFLSIDVDGADYHLWKSLGDEFTPQVVCIEFNPSIPNHIYFVQEDNIQIQQGSSLLALTELAAEIAPSVGGYQLVCTTTFNAFFVRKDRMHLLPPTTSDYSIHSLHSAAMSTDIFQTYDGKLKLCGPQKLLWHRNAINPQKIQPLSKKQQIYPFAPPINTHYLLVEKCIDDVVSLLSSALHEDGRDNLPDQLKASFSSLCNIYEVPDGHNKGKSHTFFFDAEALVLSVMLSTRMVSVLRNCSTDEGRTYEFEKIVFGHAVNVSQILINKGDRELMNDIAFAGEIYKQCLSVLSVATLQDKAYLYPYREHMTQVVTRLIRCVNTKSTDHLHETALWLFFMQLLLKSGPTNELLSICNLDLNKVLKSWQSKITNKLISMGVSKSQVGVHLSNTAVYDKIESVDDEKGSAIIVNDDFVDEEAYSLLYRATGRKMSRLLQAENICRDSVSKDVRMLVTENRILKVTVLVLIGALVWSNRSN
jgi:hypothetical protein